MYRHQQQYYYMKQSDKETNKIRLQVFLSRNGVCSRRQAMDMIKEGKVSVNGTKILEPSFAVHPQVDRISVGNKIIKSRTFDYILLFKPKGYVTTKADKFAKKTVFDLLPKQFQHLVPVGRLDKDTEGLLLLTNNGDVAHRLTHPRFKIDKVYYVEIKGLLEQKSKVRLEKGIYVLGKRTAPAKISNTQRKKDKTSLLITVHEGKKRQIRIMFSKMGHKVIYLKRIVLGPIKLGSLKSGRFRVLSKNEIQQLLDL